MGELLKFPGEAKKLGYRRVRRRRWQASEDPNQLDLFVPAVARISSGPTELGAFERALLSDESGDERAEALYLEAIEKQDCVADAFCNLGILESKKGNKAQAFDCFTTSLKHDPRHLEAHYNLANLYFEVNDFRLAQIHYEIAAQVDAGFANVYFNLALVRSLNDDLAAAIEALIQYQQRVSNAEARQADELLQTFQRSLAAQRDSARND